MSPMENFIPPALKELLQTRRAVGKDGTVFENTTGVSTANNIATLNALLNEMRPKSTMEIGLAFAGSAMLFANYHRSHVAMDFLQWDIYKDGGLANLERAGLSIDFRRERSALALGDLLREGKRFDLIYIDGSHFFDEVLIDAYFSMRLLNDGGIMAFDDSTHPDVKKVLRYISRNWKNMSPVDLSPYHPNGSSLKYRLASRLGKLQLTAFQRLGGTDRDWELRLVDF